MGRATASPTRRTVCGNEWRRSRFGCSWWGSLSLDPPYNASAASSILRDAMSPGKHGLATDANGG